MIIVLITHSATHLPSLFSFTDIGDSKWCHMKWKSFMRNLHRFSCTELSTPHPGIDLENSRADHYVS